MVKWTDITFDPEEIFDALKEEPRSVHRVVWELLFRAGAKRGARVVMDKSLDSVHYAEELMALFDDILFLNVVRDPRAQISSMNKAIIHDFDTRLNAVTWVKAYETGRKIADAHPDRVLTIRYEDFVSNQEAVLRKICAFLGIRFFSSMLDVSRSDEARKIAGLSALWESNAKAPIAANVDKFRKNLAPAEIAEIEALAGEYMDYYGYERMARGARGGALVSVNPRVLAEIRGRSETNKQKAWAELREKNFRDYELRRFRADYLRMVRERLLEERWNGQGLRAAPSREDRSAVVHAGKD
jgi:hypothetical protein